MLIYLASPYSHKDKEVEEQRFKEICKIAAKFMEEGIHLYCPIAHTHPIAISGKLPTHWEYWEQYDREILKACSEVWVVMMEGWEASKGIAAEIRIAKEMGLPIKYIDPR